MAIDKNPPTRVTLVLTYNQCSAIVPMQVFLIVGIPPPSEKFFRCGTTKLTKLPAPRRRRTKREICFHFLKNPPFFGLLLGNQPEETKPTIAKSFCDESV